MYLSFLFSRHAPSISGRWIDADCSVNGDNYGFVLINGGTARSVNAASPQYTAWRRCGKTLTLWGCAHGPHDENIDFIETMKIQRVTERELVLTRSDETFTFYRG